MSEYSQYRRAAWKLLKPVLPIMMLIAIIASLPSFVTTFFTYSTGVFDLLTQILNGTLSFEDLTVAQMLPVSLVSLLMSLISLPLAMGLTGAAQRISRQEEIGVRHALDYLPHTLRVIGLTLLCGLYAYWPMLLWAVCAIPLAFLITESTIWIFTLYILVGLGLCFVCIPRAYSVIASTFLQAQEPTEKVRTLLHRSVAAMRGYRISFFLLTFSFIGWDFLTSLITSLIVSLFGTLIGNMASMLISSVLTCYITTAQVLFIRDITTKKAPEEVPYES